MVTPLDRKLAAFLRKERGQRSYAEFSKITGLPASTLFRLENGEQSLTLGKLDAVLTKLKRSVTDAFIVCLEDGLKFKSLKRHLRTAYGMTPEAYRAKWNLPHDYPMVAPNYAEHRSQLAKKIGLGKQRAGRRK